MHPSPEVADHPARILIVDDEPHNRHLLEVILATEGFRLMAVGSGEEALAVVTHQPPDLVLLDVMMPGMDGYQVAAKIKAGLASKHIPIIMISAMGDREARLRAFNAGAEDFLSKPVDGAELRAQVRNLLRLKTHGDYHGKYGEVLEGEAVAHAAVLEEHAITLQGISTLLTVILAHSNAVLETLDPHDARRADLEQVIDASARATTLTTPVVSERLATP